MRGTTYPHRALTAGLVGALLLSCVVAVGFGAARLPVATTIDIVWAAISAQPDQAHAIDRGIVLQLRVPRVLLGAAAGACLSVVGGVLQVATRNPLADPYLFGISAGASLGAVIVLLYGSAVAGPLSLSAAAFLGAFGATAAAFALRPRRRLTDEGDHLILIGVSLGFIFHAITNFLLVSAVDRGADSALFWMMGGFGNARWSTIWLPCLAAAIGIPWLILRAGRINVLVLGDDTARTTGVDVTRLRQEIFVVTSFMTGATVAASGSIGFVGLVVPHIVRLVVGGDLRKLLPLSALIGALFLVWVDVLARTVAAPREIPLGVITSFVGGFFFLWLLQRSRPGAAS